MDVSPDPRRGTDAAGSPLEPAAKPAAKPAAASSPTRHTRGRRIRGALISSALSLVAMAVIVEVSARLLLPNPFGAESDLLGMYQNAAELGSVRSVPGWRGTHTVEGRTTSIQLNALGLRSPEVGPRRPGELRVLCLGDSFAFGYGVEAEETYPGVLGTLLEERRGQPVVSGNAGLPGNGLREQALSLGRLKHDFDPDVVVASIYLGNDFLDDQIVAKFVESGHSVSGEWAALLRESFRARMSLHSRAWMQLERVITKLYPPWALVPTPSRQQRRAFAGFPPAEEPSPRTACLFMDVIDDRRSWDPDHEYPVVPRVLARASRYLASIQAQAAPAPVVVVILPSWMHVQRDDRLALMRKIGFDPAEYRFGLIQERLQAVCAALDLVVLDVTEHALKLEDTRSIFLQENRHLNEKGHRLVAELLLEEVSALLPVGRDG